MFNPTIENIGDLSEINKKFQNFYENFTINYDPENDLDSQIKKMLDLLQEGFLSVYDEMKRRF